MSKFYSLAVLSLLACSVNLSMFARKQSILDFCGNSSCSEQRQYYTDYVLPICIPPVNLCVKFFEHSPYVHIGGPEIIYTIKGSRLLRYKGFCYTKSLRSKWSWRCLHTGHCYTALSVDQNLRVTKQPTKDHNHPPKEFVKTSSGTYFPNSRVFWTRKDELSNKTTELEEEFESDE